MTTKVCKGCGEPKPLEAFYSDKRARDGRRSECKGCYDARVKRWRQENPDKKQRGTNRPETRLATGRRYRERHPERNRENVRRWVAENPEKKAAQRKLQRAVRQGKLVRPAECEDCGREVRIHAHHMDYSKPLEVRWLCPRCHKLVHEAEAV